MILRSAHVFFKEKPAGVLTETAGGGTRFIYNTTWTESIACCLPIRVLAHEWKQGLHPFFQNLGAEGWLREAQARTAHIDLEDDFGLLLKYGADCIGAVSLQPLEESIPSLDIFENITNMGRTISGVQRKLLVVQDKKTKEFSPALPTGPAPYIAKLNSESISDLVRNENLSLQWISAVLGKNEVTDFKLGIVSQLNEVALIVTRFDRTKSGEKLRLEDFAQILCKPKGLNYHGKYESSYEEVAKVISDYSARPLIDLSRFYRRLIAFAIVGNCDAHLKNFSLLETKEGLRLSPVYDVVNTAIYQHYDQNLALSMNDEKLKIEQINGAMFRHFGKKIGLSIQIIEQIFQDLKRQVHKATPILKPHESEAPDGFVTRFEEIVRNACYRILEN